jgi:hypothetical protein
MGEAWTGLSLDHKLRISRSLGPPKDQDGYTKNFVPKAQANIKEFGGKYIGGGMNKAIGFVGAPPANRVILLQFPDHRDGQGVRGKRGA